MQINLISYQKQKKKSTDIRANEKKKNNTHTDFTTWHTAMVASRHSVKHRQSVKYTRDTHTLYQYTRSDTFIYIYFDINTFMHI